MKSFEQYFDDETTDWEDLKSLHKELENNTVSDIEDIVAVVINRQSGDKKVLEDRVRCYEKYLEFRRQKPEPTNPTAPKTYPKKSSLKKKR